MNFELSIINNNLVLKQAVSEVMLCNKTTKQYGLELTNKQARSLVDTRIKSLKENGRIEFGVGIVDKIILEFCDSPYIFSQNYEDTIHRLIEMFYYYKNETHDMISDDKLIKFMKKSYDTICQGSLELLSGRELSNLVRTLRYSNKENITDNNKGLDKEESFE